MWFIKIACYATIWATQPCDIYPSPVTASLAELTTFNSRSPFNNPAMCERVGGNVAKQNETRTGNNYEAECVRR